MTGDEKGYNGWKNYETWNVALWIGNEQWSETRSREMAQEAWDESGGPEDAAYLLEKRIKAWVEDEMVPDLRASMASDLLGAALSEVDWREIAENWLSDVDRTEEEPDDDEAQA